MTLRNSLRVPFTAADAVPGEAGLLPFLPLTLLYQGRSTGAQGLLDTGAAVNVLPYRVGLELGADWSDQPATLRLSGNLANLSARPLIVSVAIGQFTATRLAFAWTEAETVPLILGQVNFFMEFDSASIGHNKPSRFAPRSKCPLVYVQAT